MRSSQLETTRKLLQDLLLYLKVDQEPREGGRHRHREGDLFHLAHHVLHLVKAFDQVTHHLGTKNSRALIKTPKAAKNNSLL